MLTRMSFLGRLARSVVAASTMVLLAAACTHDSTCTAIPAIQSVPIIPTPTLVSPAPGATGVSTGPLDVTIGVAFAASSLFLKDSSGNVTFATNYRQANPPSNEVRIGTFAKLATQTVYQVYAVVIVPSLTSSACSLTPAPAATQNVLLGSFTTG
jgi:hypothetical protein